MSHHCSGGLLLLEGHLEPIRFVDTCALHQTAACDMHIRNNSRERFNMTAIVLLLWKLTAYVCSLCLQVQGR